MIAHQVLVEMLRRETIVAAAIQRLDLRLPLARHPLARGLAQATVQQPALATLLKADTPRRNVRSLTPSTAAASIWLSSLPS
jgi:hypothetical protein